jgi:hypothetical protein
MFAPSTALPDFTMPMRMRAFFDARDKGDANTPVDRPGISPYLRRPLRRLEEVEKAREKKGGKKPEKDPDVTERR